MQAQEPQNAIEWKVKWAKRLADPVYNGILTMITFIYTIIVYIITLDEAKTLMDYSRFSLEIPALILTLIFLLDLIANLICLGFRRSW
jgi:lipopolysaccharide/colanic/teichoic acid biosynthesis glycosyltransferase